MALTVRDCSQLAGRVNIHIDVVADAQDKGTGIFQAPFHEGHGKSRGGSDLSGGLWLHVESERHLMVLTMKLQNS